MATKIDFKRLNDVELVQELGKLKEFTNKYPKTLSPTPAKLQAEIKNWQNSLEKLPEPAFKDDKIEAVKLTAAQVEKLRAIHESNTPTAEAIIGQKLPPEKIIGTLFSSLTTLEYTKMEAEFKKRTGEATTGAAKEKVKQEWENVVKGAQQAFASAGLPGVKETDLKKFSEELSAKKANFNAIVNIANTGVAITGLAGVALTGQTVLKAGFVTQTGVLLDASIINTTIEGLCSRPFAEGTFTKHFSKSFSLVVRIPYWCPTWTNPFRVCHKNVTLAGLSFSVDVSVGYRVTCCGATAWGQAGAQVCATLVGIRFCAGCTARITGVSGVGRSTSGGNCVYGIGINAQLKCTFAGITVLNLQAPFGFNVTGPCPPAGLC